MKISKKELTVKNREIFKNKTEVFQDDARNKNIGDAFIRVINIQKNQGTAPFSLPDGRNYWAQGTKSKKFNNTGLYKIYNFGRNVDKRPASQKECILCLSQRLNDKDIGIIIDNKWEAKANVYPVFEAHGNIVHRDHIKQKLEKQDIEKVLNWVKQSSETRFFYNGLYAGATIKKHKHIQYFSGMKPYKELNSLNGKMPIEVFFDNKKRDLLYNKKGINVFKINSFPDKSQEILILAIETKLGGDRVSPQLADSMMKILELIKKQKLDYNILWTTLKRALPNKAQDNNDLRIFIIPRTGEKLVSRKDFNKLSKKDKKWSAVIEKGREILLTERIKPRGFAALEFSGIFIAFDYEQYQKTTYNDFLYILNELGLPAKSKKAENLLNRVKSI